MIKTMRLRTLIINQILNIKKIKNFINDRFYLLSVNYLPFFDNPGHATDIFYIEERKGKV
jgi:hypothetical protein